MRKFFALILLSFATFSFTPEQTTWCAIGDSITYLNDHLAETGNRVTKGYMTRVTEKLPGIRYINQGHNGWTAEKIAKNIDQLGLEKSDIYTVFLGTNDWWQGRPVGVLADFQHNTGSGTLYGSFRIILDKLKSLNREAKIILITPMQRVDFVYIANMKNNAWGSYREKNGQMLEQFANAIMTIGAAENLQVVDLFHEKKLKLKNLVRFKRLKDAGGVYRNLPYPEFIGVPFDPAADEYPYPPEAIAGTYDGLHPSDKGYAVIAGLLIDILRKR